MSIIQENTRQFIERQIELIDANAFDQLYEVAKTMSIPARDITDALDTCGIEHLPYMEIVPQAYLRASRNSHPEIIVPSNILAIEGNAFSATDAKVIRVEEGCIEILNNCFSMCGNLERIYLPSTIQRIDSRICNGSDKCKDIIYNGTIEQWNNINKKYFWYTSYNSQRKDVKIHCLDGIINPFEEDTSN